MHFTKIIAYGRNAVNLHPVLKEMFTTPPGGGT